MLSPSVGGTEGAILAPDPDSFLRVPPATSRAPPVPETSDPSATVLQVPQGHRPVTMLLSLQHLQKDLQCLGQKIHSAVRKRWAGSAQP